MLSSKGTPSRAATMLALPVAGALLLAAAGCQWDKPQRADIGSGTEHAEAAPAIAAEQQQRLDDADDARQQGDYARALALFREILAENPTVTSAYLGIGRVYAEQGDFASAEPAYARAAQLEPRNYDAQLGHGVSLQALDRNLDAVRAYQRALSIRPDSAEANRNLGSVYLQMGEPQSAKVFAERAVEAAPDDGAARISLGAVYTQLGLYNEAIDEYRTAMELVDPSPELVLNLVNALAKAKRYRETIEAAENLNRMQPNADAFERIGWAWFRLKDYDRSAEAYRQAVELQPDHWQSWNGIGVNSLNRWLLSKKRDSEAKREAGEALRQSLRINSGQQKVIQLVSTYQL